MIDIQNTILGKIVDRKHEELTARLKQRSLHDVEQWAKEATPVRGFANALQHKRPRHCSDRGTHPRGSGPQVQNRRLRQL